MKYIGKYPSEEILLTCECNNKTLKKKMLAYSQGFKQDDITRNGAAAEIFSARLQMF